MKQAAKKETTTDSRNTGRKSLQKSSEDTMKTGQTKKQTTLQPENPLQKRLYRVRKHAMIAGVAAGLGEYFSLDPAIFRLLFVLATFFGGSGIPVYIILWIILPESENGTIGSSETLQANTEELREKASEFTKSFRTGGSEKNSRVVLGYVLIGLGVVFVMQNFGFFRADIFWPLLLVVIGFFLLRSTS